MKNKDKNIGGSGDQQNKPSTGQPSTGDQPEHTGNAEQSPAGLHQGQGPEFQTQDPTLRKQNQGVQDANREPAGFKQGSPSGEKNKKNENAEADQKKPLGQKTDQTEDPGESEPHREELPSREKEKPYVGDNPEETKRQAPKMK